MRWGPGKNTLNALPLVSMDTVRGPILKGQFLVAGIDIKYLPNRDAQGLILVLHILTVQAW